MRTPTSPSTDSARPGGSRSGQTLVEVVVTISITSVLVMGMGSAILIATHALPSRSASVDPVQTAADVAEQLAAELHCAVSFTQKTGAAITFRVPDRNNDTVAESIAYSWSGTPGTPLTRDYNGVVTIVLDNVQELALTYDLRAVTVQPDAATKETGEYLLSGYDGSAAPGDYAIEDKVWIGQYFFPSLPADTVSWKVTRVMFKAREHGAAKGVTAVQLRTPDASNLPTTTVLAQVLMPESTLGAAYLWQTFSFGTVSGLSPAQGLCLVLALSTSDAHLADVQYNAPGGSNRLTTSNAGSSWTKDAANSMIYYVYGTATTSTLPAAITRSWLRRVNIIVRAGADAALRVETAARVLNEPEVTGL